MKPTVGRIVHYRHSNGDGPFAAMIAAVHAHDAVSAQIFTPEGGRWFAKELPHGQSSSDTVQWWDWPPRVDE